MQTEILKIIPESLRPKLIKEVVDSIKHNSDFLKDNGIDERNIYDDIKAWAEKKVENKN
jgi:hypothetical protein